MASGLEVYKRARRLTDIATAEGFTEVGKTVLRELMGQLRYGMLHLANPKGYYRRDVQGSKMYLSINDPGISKDLIIRGMRERYETKMIRSVLRPGMTVVDVGANIGYYALMEAMAVTEMGHVYAIEPAPENVKLLQRNIHLNGYPHVSVIEAGISDETGRAKLYVSRCRNLHNLLRPRHAIVGGESVVDIEVYRLDDLLAKHQIDVSRINLIRMDIEGYEVKALNGMINTLRLSPRLMLFIEFHPQYVKGMKGYSLESTLESLAGLGFKIVYGTAQKIAGGSLEFTGVTIGDFLADGRVSMRNVFLLLLEKGSGHKS